MNKNITVVLVVLAAGCTTGGEPMFREPPMDSSRKVSEQDCAKPIESDGGNLMCKGLTLAERRSVSAEEERQARARREAEEREARERAERERAEQLAREEAARKERAAEEERLAAAAALKAQEERERQAKAEAEALARQRAEQEAREAAERECRRLEQERLQGRALLTNFVSNYGKVDEYKEIAGQITGFLDKAADAKPCPPPG